MTDVIFDAVDRKFRQDFPDTPSVADMSRLLEAQS